VPLTAPAHLPAPSAPCRASEHGAPHSVKIEIRDNLLAALRAGRDPWPGILGFSPPSSAAQTCRCSPGTTSSCSASAGGAETRLLRALAGLLDEWTPVIAGAEAGRAPPARSRRCPAPPGRRLGDDLPVEWRHRSERYTEKLATPDTAVADLIGDVDPVKVADGHSLGDPETIHYGLVPRAHRGIVAINELPDLAERIQVSLLNVMEERDIQVRGYTLRLPLDVLLVASANPEDYTNRGRIITPLKDRFGAEVRTHYPLELTDELAVMGQEADLVAPVPTFLLEILARFTRALRESVRSTRGQGVGAVLRRRSRDGRRGRAPPAAAGSRTRRPGRSTSSRCRTCCAASWSSPPARRAARPRPDASAAPRTADRRHRPRPAARLDPTPLAEAVSRVPGTHGERVPAAAVVSALPRAAVLTEIARRLDAGGTGDPGPMASAARSWRSSTCSSPASSSRTRATTRRSPTADRRRGRTNRR
jgi:magnesium chelatase subunit I